MSVIEWFSNEVDTDRKNYFTVTVRSGSYSNEDKLSELRTKYVLFILNA